MKFFNLALAGLASCVACVSMPRVPAQLRPMATRDDVVVAIDSMCIGDDPFMNPAASFSMGRGSGVLIDGRHVLTADHVVACPYLPDVHITTADGRRRKVVVEWESEANDLARLVIADASNFGPVAPPVVGPARNQAYVCSAFAVPSRGGSCGLVESVNGPAGEDVAITNIVHHGNSGGPVYDSEGYLVGIITKLAQLPDGTLVGGTFQSLDNHPEAFR